MRVNMSTKFLRVLISLSVLLFFSTLYSQDNPDGIDADQLQNADSELNLPQVELTTNSILNANLDVNNSARVIQNGSNQTAYIEQVQGSHAVVYQGGGDGNFLNLKQSGDRNVSVLVQDGSGNHLNQDINGNNSGSVIFQKGDNNVIQQQFYTDDLRYAITQFGNDNKVIQTDEGTGNAPPKLGIIQKGNGMELRIIQGNIDYTVAPQQ